MRILSWRGGGEAATIPSLLGGTHGRVSDPQGRFPLALRGSVTNHPLKRVPLPSRPSGPRAPPMLPDPPERARSPRTNGAFSWDSPLSSDSLLVLELASGFSVQKLSVPFFLGGLGLAPRPARVWPCPDGPPARLGSGAGLHRHRPGEMVHQDGRSAWGAPLDSTQPPDGGGPGLVGRPRDDAVLGIARRGISGFGALGGGTPARSMSGDFNRPPA